MKISAKKNRETRVPDDIKEMNEETAILHEEEIKTLRAEENLVESQAQGYYDVFRIEPSELFPEKFVKAVGLPKFSFTQNGRVDKHQNLFIELYNESPVAKNILKFSKNPFDIVISLTSIDNETGEELQTDWKLKSAQIVSADFGSLISTMREDYRTVVCEISFMEFEIDGLSIKIP